MTIDWFTIGAQIVNFLVLVYLLHRFLYGPIVNAMERREHRIKDRLEEAEAKRQEAEEEAESYRERQREFDAERSAKVAQLEKELEEQRSRRLNQARREIEEQRQQWESSLHRDREDFLRELRQRTSEDVYAIARRALADLADVELQQQAVRAFLHRLEETEGEQREEIARSIRRAEKPVVVRTAFELDEEQRQVICKTLKAYADGAEVDVTFDQAPDLVFGIALDSYSHVAAWHLDDYLDLMVERTSEFLAAESGHVEETEPK